MGLRKHVIEWNEGPAAPDAAMPHAAVPSPALELQAMLTQHHIRLNAPAIDREVLRRLLTTLAVTGCTVWATLVASADIAVSLVA